VLGTDALAWMRLPAQAARFDLVLLDPPFDGDLFLPALAAAAQAVAPGGWIYLEAAEPWPALSQRLADTLAPADQLACQPLRLHRDGRAGAVHFHLFQCGAAT